MNAGNYEYVLESVLRIQRQNHPNPHMSSYLKKVGGKKQVALKAPEFGWTTVYHF